MITDLKRLGLFEETLILWGGGFGRTPTVELPQAGANAGKVNGRDHNHWGFTCWLAGGGVKGGQVYGATGEFGFKAVEKPVHVHDLHATMLKLLGFDHTRLTYRYAGRDFRLTDVHANVVNELIACPRAVWKARKGSFPQRCDIFRGILPVFVLKTISEHSTKSRALALIPVDCEDQPCLESAVRLSPSGQKMCALRGTVRTTDLHFLEAMRYANRRRSRQFCNPRLEPDGQREPICRLSICRIH